MSASVDFAYRGVFVLMNVRILPNNAFLCFTDIEARINSHRSKNKWS